MNVLQPIHFILRIKTYTHRRKIRWFIQVK